MNSHQRRLDRRLWRYEVSVDYMALSAGKRPYPVYLEIWDWCTDNWGSTIGSCGWREKRDSRAVWQFNDPNKAVLFALRWA